MKSRNMAVAVALAAALASGAAAQTPAGGASPKPAVPAKPAAAKPAPAKTAKTAKPSGSDRLDGIAAVVNDDVVLQSDVEDQLYQFLAQAHVQPDPAALDTLRRQVLDQLINERLIVAEAKRNGLTANDAEVSRQVDEAVRQKKDALGGEQAFQDQLKAENMTEAMVRDRYHQQLERELLARRMIEKALPRKPVSPTDAEAYFKQYPEKFPTRPSEVRLQVIQIPVSPDSAADAKGKAAALEARRRIVGGEKFAKVAAEVSDDPGTARSGGDLGFFTRGSMDPGIEDAAFSLKLNELSQPVHSMYGWHLLEVLERDTLRTRAGKDSLDDRGVPLLEAHARHILVRVPTGDADTERARALAARVRAEAAKGTFFGTLVHRYSRYKGQQDQNGDIGFISTATLQPSIRIGIDSLEVGQLSDVLQNQIGFNIFKVVDRKPERRYTYDEIKDELPDAVAEIKLRERYEEWVKGLRAKAHVEIRSS
ncbi:MAG TPA: peptidylprolyl isomerase [Candidatus Eisenbacteria bacterium]